MTSAYKNWKSDKDSQNIYWLYFDKHNENVNTINREVLDELEQVLQAINRDNTAKGLVIASAKKSGFIAGAEIDQFTKLETPDAAHAFIKRGQEVFSQLAALSIPTVAMIDGFCLGGGLELALACNYRVAEEGPKTKLGLPEVMLGIHPGWGGTVRLPALIGAIKAMPLILSGKILSAKAAAKLGFVDVVVPKRQLVHAAQQLILTHPRIRHGNWLAKLSNSAIARPWLARLFTKKTAKLVNPEQYPAPFSVIDIWKNNGINLEAAQDAEANSIAKLVNDKTAQNLVRIFFLRERLKGLAKGSDTKFHHVHVIGAGTMGGDIAAWCAANGLMVTLQDREAKYIAPAIKRAYGFFKKKLKTPRAIQAATDRLMPDVQGEGAKNADVIIEAIFENLEAKQALFKSLETIIKPNAIMATNTSSIPLDEINTSLNDPSRLVGIHFFNPVTKMPLVEVVIGKKTSDKVTKEAMAFVKAIDRLPLPVTSSPGFLVNRVLMPYLMESLELLNEGVPAYVIDKTAKDFGMPMGPIELADTVGLDICLSVAKNLTQHFGGKVPERLEKMVAEGQLGKKSGKGFYNYKNGEAQKEFASSQVPEAEICDRLILRYVNEAMACLREGVVQDGDLLDAGMVFGTGFAPFRGGPMQYVCQTGRKDLYERLKALQDKFGDRFKPDTYWETKCNEKSTTKQTQTTNTKSHSSAE